MAQSPSRFKDMKMQSRPSCSSTPSLVSNSNKIEKPRPMGSPIRRARRAPENLTNSFTSTLFKSEKNLVISRAFGSPSYPAHLDCIRAFPRKHSKLLSASSCENVSISEIGHNSFDLNATWHAGYSNSMSISRNNNYKDSREIESSTCGEGHQRPERLLNLNTFDTAGDSLGSFSYTGGILHGTFNTELPARQRPGSALGSTSWRGGATSVDLGTSLGQSWQFRTFQVQAGMTGLQTMRNPNKAIMTLSANYHVVMANDTACKLFGYERAELIGRPMAGLLEPDFMEKQKSTVEEQMDTRSEVVVVTGKVIEAQHHNGRTFPISIWMKKLETTEDTVGDRVRFVVVIERVSRSDSYFRLSEDGDILEVDNVFLRMFGIPSSDSVIDTKLTDLIPSSTAPRNIDIDNTVQKLGSSKMWEFQQCTAGVTSDDNTFPLTLLISPTAQGIGYSASIQVYATISGLVTLLPNGIIHSCNHNFSLMLFGYERSELVNEDINVLIPNFHSFFEYDEDGYPLISEEERLDYPEKDGEHVKEDSDNESRVLPEGSFHLMARHKDGLLMSVIVQLKRVYLADGSLLYCAWLRREQDTVGLMGANHLDESCDMRVGQSINGSTVNDVNESLLLLSTKKNRASDDNILAGTPALYEDDVEEKMGIDMNDIGEPIPVELSETMEFDQLMPGRGDFDRYYRTLHSIGKGAFGFVKMAAHKETGELVVVKFICKEKVLADCWTKTLDGKDRIPLEIAVLKALDHPNIVHVADVYENEDFFQLIMEKHGPGMDLFEYIDENTEITEDLARHIFKQLMDAVDYLHSCGILHRDIKDENIILDEHFNVKLIDFGSCSYMTPGHLFSTFCGTLEYCSPEVLLGNRYPGPELEVWSIGITFYTLLFGENPFYDIDETIQGIIDPPFAVSDLCMDLVHIMLEVDPKNRATIAQIRNHPWMTIETTHLPLDLSTSLGLDASGMAAIGFGAINAGPKLEMDGDSIPFIDDMPLSTSPVKGEQGELSSSDSHNTIPISVRDDDCDQHYWSDHTGGSAPDLQELDLELRRCLSPKY